MIRSMLAVLLFLCGCAPLAQSQPLSPLMTNGQLKGAYVTYLPHVVTAPPPLPPPCLDSWAAYAFYWLLRNDARQQHGELTCDPRLVKAARMRAYAQPPWGISHCDVLGLCANVYVRRAGFPLPSWYAVNGNNVESIMAGTADPVEAYRALARSPNHAVHLFGENDFFRQQNHIGIALVEVPTNRYQWVWIILITGKGVESGE